MKYLTKASLIVLGAMACNTGIAAETRENVPISVTLRAPVLHSCTFSPETVLSIHLMAGTTVGTIRCRTTEPVDIRFNGNTDADLGSLMLSKDGDPGPDIYLRLSHSLADPMTLSESSATTLTLDPDDDTIITVSTSGGEYGAGVYSGYVTAIYSEI